MTRVAIGIKGGPSTHPGYYNRTKIPYAPRHTSSAGDGRVLRPVFGIDIDGTLGNYWSHFIKFAEKWLGREIAPWEAAVPGVSLAAHCKVTKATYRRIKLAYRQGGMKRSMPVYAGAPEMVRDLRKKGAEVWLCTTRPYLQISGVEEDTRHWLRRHGFTYDNFLFGEDKYRKLVAELRGPERVAAVLDDLPEMWTQAANFNLPIVKVGQPYNGLEPWADISGCHRELLQALKDWEDKTIAAGDFYVGRKR